MFHLMMCAATSMNRFFILFLIFLFTFDGIKAEIKICANRANDNCKLLEGHSVDFQCVFVTDYVDCMLQLQNNKADVGLFSAENALIAAENKFIGGTSEVIAEIRNLERLSSNFEFQTVVVVRSDYAAGNLSNLRGKRYCHPGFDRGQYWTNTVLKAFERRVLRTFLPENCEANKTVVEKEIEALSKFFGSSCRPGLWTVNQYHDSQLKKKYSSLCAACDNKADCSYASLDKESVDKTLQCLTSGAGEIAYTSLDSVKRYFELLSSESVPPASASDYRYLCPNGTLQNLATANPCTWIQQSWPVIIANKAKRDEVLNKFRQAFMYDQPQWGSYLKNLFTTREETVNMLQVPISTYDYVSRGRFVLNATKNQCQDNIRWCTKDAAEQQKCLIIQTAAKTHGIKPSFDCVEGSKIQCMKKVQNNDADIVATPSNFGYVSRSSLGLTPAMFIESERAGNYFSIILTKRGSGITRFTDLKQKRACFPIYNGLGWLSFIDVARNRSIINRDKCSGNEEPWQFFKETCAPGAQDPNINPESAKAPSWLCSGCSRQKDGNCEVAAKNAFFGEIGALRCLEGKVGDVAFVDYNTIIKFLTSNKVDSNFKLENYQVICKDDTLANLTNIDLPTCSLIQVIAAEIMQRENQTDARSKDIQFALEELNDWFGTSNRRYHPVFKMFEKFNNTENVLIPGNPIQLANAYDQDSTYVNNYKLLLNRFSGCPKSDSSSPILQSSQVLIITFITSLIANCIN